MTTTSEIPRLRQGVSLIVGMDNQPMLFDSDSGKYHRLGAAAAFIVGQFDGRRSLPTIIDQLPQDIDDAGAQRITRMVELLRTNRLLEGTKAQGNDYVKKPVEGRHVAPPRRGKHAHAQPPRWNGGWLLPRFIIMRSYRRVVAPIVTLLHHLPVRVLSIVFLLASAAGYAAGLISLRTLAGGPRPGMQVVVIAVIIQLVSIVAHESWHAIVAGYLGAPVRGLGVAFMFWVVPIAFVDRTDAYQVRSRWGRAMLALAGICSDGVICGLEAAVAAASSGTVRQVALTLCAFQITMLFTNLHPLTQSDGVAAMEALTGSVNLRGRSVLTVRSVFRRRPLPPALARMPLVVRCGYFIYGLMCVMLGIAFTCVSITTILFILVTAVRGMFA